MSHPNPDSSEYAALVEFIATSGRSRAHPAIAANAPKLIRRMWESRARAMTGSIVALAKAAMPPRHNN